MFFIQISSMKDLTLFAFYSHLPLLFIENRFCKIKNNIFAAEMNLSSFEKFRLNNL